MKENCSYIQTIQPFLMLNTEKGAFHSFKEESNAEYFGFKGKPQKNDDYAHVTFLPDGCTSLIFCYSKHSFSSFAVVTNSESVLFKIERNTEYFQVKYQPGQNPFLTNEDVKKAGNKIIPLEELAGTEILCLAMKAADSFERRKESFCKIMESSKHENEASTLSLFRQLMQIVVQKNGLIKISELEKLSGYSARYINHLFETYCGISAKHFSNIVKFQLVLGEINGSQASFSKIASNWKFYDQSHFIHEFKSYTGLTPGDYNTMFGMAV